MPNEPFVYRDVIGVVPTCPVEANSATEACNGCPYNLNRGKPRAPYAKIKCSNLTDEEKKLAPEPVKVNEPKSKW